MLITNDERRVFRRMAIDAAVTVTRGESKIQGVCKDLSSTGMLLQFQTTDLNPEDTIQVVLATPDARIPPLDVQAKVLRVSQESAGYIVATEFLTIK